MNEQETKEILNDFSRCVTVKADGVYETDDFIKARENAISALEKQIPKKPLLYKPYEGKCPVCSVIFLNKLTCYCGNCGQKLDWSE